MALNGIGGRPGSGVVGESSGKTVPLRAPLAPSYTIDRPTQDPSHASGLGHEGPCDIDRLIKVLEKRFVVAGAPTPPSSNTSESGENEANGKVDGKPEIKQGSKLEYKQVDEV